MNTYGRLLPMCEPLDRGPGEPTAYEAEATRLGLPTEEAQVADLRLRQWVRLHYRALYVPESVLCAAGIEIEEWSLPAGMRTNRGRSRHRVPGGE